MSHRKSSTPATADSDKRRSLDQERPERHPDPDTLEGPGDRQEAQEESDARDKVTRRGER